MSTPELDVIDLDRGGRWCQVVPMEATSVGQARNGAEQLAVVVGPRNVIDPAHRHLMEPA